MGSSGTETPTKAPKASSSQEQSPTPAAPVAPPTPGAAVYPEWGGFQAYPPMAPHGFFPSPMASTAQAPPYVWGTQHLMSPYGTPAPYVMYPQGGIYAHPSMHPGPQHFTPYPMVSPNGNAEAPGVGSGGEDAEGKTPDGKEKSPQKGSKGTLGSLNMITGKNNNELAKISEQSNGAASQSGESRSEDSSEGSDANSQKDSQTKAGDNEAEVVPNGGSTTHGSQNGDPRMAIQAVPNQGMSVVPLQVTGAPAGVSGPTTNLNIGMDYWAAPAASPIVPLRSKVSNPPVMTGLVPSAVGGNRENIPSDLWLQDERELKRQRRKQSNRESARRSRLRKQAECEELGRRVEDLNQENASLRAELDHLSKEYQKLLSENTSLKERLSEVPNDDETRLDLSDLHSADQQNMGSEVQDVPADNKSSS